jgi:hypothetical protein
MFVKVITTYERSSRNKHYPELDKVPRLILGCSSGCTTTINLKERLEFFVLDTIYPS